MVRMNHAQPCFAALSWAVGGRWLCFNCGWQLGATGSQLRRGLHDKGKTEALQGDWRARRRPFEVMQVTKTKLAPIKLGVARDSTIDTPSIRAWALTP